ncbi:MAG: tRNA pseudouridine(13) synthase TruD [Desulfosarcinaceae bacterium]
MPEPLIPTFDPIAMTAELKARLIGLPCVSEALPGVGGVIKTEPEHFEVEEILPYSACGEGEHVFITLRRSGWNTPDVARALINRFKIPPVDVGWGGRKDKRAVVTQTFSVRLPLGLPLPRIQEELADLPFEILGIERHRNKLKTGHVAGNRFCILLSRPDPGALDQAGAIAEMLRRLGIPNYFGEQRFGIAMRNLDRAAGLLARKRTPRGRDNLFLVSALQSALFNCWLGERFGDGFSACMLPGDVARKTDTGGLFLVEDEKDANTRFNNGEIVYTGPMFGHKMKAAGHLAARREAALLQRFALQTTMFKPLRAPGTRRAGLIRLDDLAIRPASQGLEFRFTLPAGSYATTVMREFTRPQSPGRPAAAGADPGADGQAGNES